MRHRTTPCLKKFYNNKKKEIRKEVAVENKEKVLTGGGGVAPLKDIEEKELLLGLMNHKTVYGLHNEFDSDQPLTSILEEYDMEEEIEINATEEAEYVPKRQKKECLTEEPIPSCSGMQSTWKRVTPTILSTPISVPLKSGSFEGQDTPRKVLDSSRRRPTTVIKALTSSAIAEKFDMLLERRLAISNMEAKEIEDRLQWQQKMQQEQLQKIQLEKEKIQLEKESLLLDIALKKEQLRVLKM